MKREEISHNTPAALLVTELREQSSAGKSSERARPARVGGRRDGGNTRGSGPFGDVWNGIIIKKVKKIQRQVMCANQWGAARERHTVWSSKEMWRLTLPCLVHGYHIMRCARLEAWHTDSFCCVLGVMYTRLRKSGP